MVISEREVEKNCFTPRDYQVELLDKACKRNIIVQLGTGAGKTFIAVLLLKEYGLQLYSSYQNGGKRAFFIVSTVALVEQQAQHIECHTRLKVARMHGNLNNDMAEGKRRFDAFMKEHHVVVLTAQILLDLVDHAFFDLRRAAVLIFDECHHAMGMKHPYRVLMGRYMDLPEKERPRVLGLTASLINDKTPPNTLEAKLSKLESVMHSVIETASDLVTLSKYGAKPREHIVVCHAFTAADDESARLLSLIEAVGNFCKRTSEFNPEFDIDIRRPIYEALTRTSAVLSQIGLWAGWKVAQIWEKQLKKLTEDMTHLPENAIDFLLMGQTCMNTVKRRLNTQMRSIKTLADLQAFLPDKLNRLLDLLMAYSPENQAKHGVKEPLCAIIFVDQRYVAYVMSLVLKFVSRLDPAYTFLQPDFVIGFSGPSLASEESQSLHKRQDEVLRKFRRGELNVLIATSVLEEGVDVRHCNLVIRFDRPIEYRSYVQSKGRARKPGALYVMMVEDKYYDKCSEDIRDFILIEKLLLKRYKTVHNPGEFEASLPQNVDALYPPYVVEATNAKVTLSTAVALVNRYCGKLPSDIFTRLVPQNRIIPVTVEGTTMYKAELLLPINSPIKEPIRLETPVDSKKMAQMCVALEACRKLHLRGELDDHLLPVGRESIALLSQLDEDPDELLPGLNAKVGSARRKQLYDKRIAKALHDALIQPGQECYLYVIEMELLREPQAEHNPKRRKFAKPEEYDSCFGFLSSKILPALPAFPAYLRQGDMRVHIVRASEMVTINSQSLTLIKHFHDYIFRNVLQLGKEHMAFNMSETSTINTLIVPLNRESKAKYSINMDYVKKVVQNLGEMPRRPDDEDRKNYKFRAEDYRDAVVMPWYRNVDAPVFYYVAEIIEDMNPSSQFPDAEYTSFNEYFIKKYELTIYDQEQHLLDVDFTSNRLNLLLPRAGGAKKRTRNENSQQQIFVPELMDKHPISATLWNLIAALPSCFYRMNHLLLADELRTTIGRESLKIQEDVLSPPDTFDWAPLSYPATYEEKQSLIVSKIEQLREMNKTKETENGRCQPSSTQGEFEIGVWDPEMGAGLTWDGMPQQKEKNDGPDDTAGLFSPNVAGGGDLSDDEEDANAVIMVDFAKYLAEKSGSRADFAAPRADIVEFGWGDVEDVGQQDTPFQILGCGSAAIDMNSLMADVCGQILPKSTTEPTPPSGSNPKKPQKNVNLAIDPLAKFADSKDIGEDRERSKEKEEVIDLAAYESEGEKEEDLITDASEQVSDDEFHDLEEGEMMKHRVDEAFVPSEELPKGEVLAPELEGVFSFASPSPSMTRFGGDCPPESAGNDLMYLNPYGVSPCLLLTALTTSNANDGINLERLETIGDSFLKYAVTDYLYHTHSDQHEGKLSFARSKEVSNCNLYRLGKRIGIPSLLVGAKFDVQDSWLPPCYVPVGNFKAPNTEDAEEKDRFMENVLEGTAPADQAVKEATGWDQADANVQLADGVETINFPKSSPSDKASEEIPPLPYNMLTQQYISDKSIADAVEALIGAHLLSLGPHPTLKFMKWLGLKVIDDSKEAVKTEDPLLKFVDSEDDPTLSQRVLKEMYAKFEFQKVEETIKYRFENKAYLLQAFTHASYYKNRITGCYQRLEFLGDAVLDYMITRFLYEDSRQYSPGVLTDLRSALVNNTIFASLAVKNEFHKHFVAMCPGLHHMNEKFVKLCQERNLFDANFNAEMYMVTTEEEIDEGQEEDIEVPKALSDIFESIAGAVYLDSGRNLDVVWRVFHNLMKQTIDECCANPPRSPIRELMELEPGKTRFSKLERIVETGKVRVTVEVDKKMRFTGMGRNYRIAKTTAAKRALRYLKSLEEQKLRTAEKKAADSA